MITDKEHLFSDTQDLGGLLDNSITSTNEYDLAPMGSPTVAVADWENLDNFAIGTGETLYLYVQVDETFAGGTTVQVRLVSDTASAQTDAGNSTLADSGAIAIADLVAGVNELWVPVSPHVQTFRFVRVLYTGAGTFTAGMVTANLQWGAASKIKQYGSALSI